MRFLILVLLLTSSVSHANCGDLDIQIINKSKHNCTLEDYVQYHGTFADQLDYNIPAGQSSPVYTIINQEPAGIWVVLTYRCDNELAKFYSAQGRCGFLGVGKPWGESNLNSTLRLDFTAHKGSYVANRAGKIIWTIS